MLDDTIRNYEELRQIIDAGSESMTHKDAVEVLKLMYRELADALIRIFDLAGALELDIGGALVEKLVYNQNRADHKPENRRAAGGKAY